VLVAINVVFTVLIELLDIVSLFFSLENNLRNPDSAFNRDEHPQERELLVVDNTRV